MGKERTISKHKHSRIQRNIGNASGAENVEGKEVKLCAGESGEVICMQINILSLLGQPLFILKLRASAHDAPTR